MLDKLQRKYEVDNDEKELFADKLILEGSSYFDKKYYKANYTIEDDYSDAFEHYLKVGYKQGFNPSRKFNTDYYMRMNPDVVLKGVNPLVHFLKYGKEEGRLPKPLATLEMLKRYFRDFCRRPQLYFKKVPGFFRQLRKVGVSSLVNQLNDKVTRENSPLGIDYQSWILEHDLIDNASIDAATKHISVFKIKPVISIIMPTYNTPERFLVKAIESVKEQIYPYWELCIADDASTKDSVRKVIQKYAQQDKRIKVVIREENGHISTSSNSALELATGDYIALLDHDDVLSVEALCIVAAYLNKYPKARLLYSDEDKLDYKGDRHSPYFKPGWNPDLLRSQNYISHLGVYERSRILEIGGFREGFEGSQDYDLVLRFTKGLAAEEVQHIPFILYHWRQHEESTALNDDQKGYAHDAGLKAMNNYLDSVEDNHARASLLSDWGTMIRVQYELPKKQPLVSIIVPTRNNADYLKRCLDTVIEKTKYKNFEILVIDNQSDDQTCFDYFETLSDIENIRVITYDKPFNYSAVNNFAVRQAKGEVICLLNDDTEVISQGWLSEMVSHALRPSIGAVGAKLVYPDATVQHAGVVTGLGGVAGHVHKHIDLHDKGYFFRGMLIQNYSAVTAACLVVLKDIYIKVGGLDEKNLKIAFNDVDFCLRIRELGVYNLWTPYAQLYHYESKSRGYEDTPEKVLRFQQEIKYMQERWGDELLNDPAYNPNLSLASEQWHIAASPRVQKPWISYVKNKS